MEELSFRELRHTQQKIMDYKTLIADKIGLINDSGKRVLNPRFFLSGEVAAYKFLCYWEKKMEQGEDFIDAKVLGLMDDIKWMLYWADQDFAEEDTLIEYEGCNTSLWIDLLAGKSNEARRKIDRDIVASSPKGRRMKRQMTSCALRKRILMIIFLWATLTARLMNGL